MLQQAFEANSLYEFIEGIIEIVNEENEEKAKFEIYLHHNFLDKTYNEFYGISDQNKPEKTEVYDDEYVETTKNKAKGILKKFKMK